MWLDLLERLILAILSILLGVTVGCALMGPPSQQGPDIDQQTTATQSTVQAAPDSVVNLSTRSGPTQPADP